MKDFIDLIKDNSFAHPNRVAVIDGDRKINYADFLCGVSKISHQLTLKTDLPKVVFDLNQGIEAYQLVVAVLNVGGTYCPLNPDAPLGRKLQIINEFAPDFIVVNSEETSLLSPPAQIITIGELLSKSDITPIGKNHNEEETVYVIYTSGTTGKPKGVVICRKAINKFLEWSIPAYSANENDIWGQYSLLSFDLSVVDILTCLCSGATLYSMNDVPAKKNRPAGIIEKEKITVWHSIPSAVEFMIANEGSKTYDFSSLRLMSFCGEPLRKHQVEFLFKKKNELTIFNTYGPTEGTLFCTCQELTVDNYPNYCDFTMSIGKAIPGWNLQLKPVADSIEKEIVIFGDYIGRGYLGSVIDSRFTQLSIEGTTVRAFESGDFVTEKEGNLYFSCRKDRQVKIKGFRVELDEIDFWINEFVHKTSVTIVKKDSLYSFIESEEEVKGTELRDFLKTKLEQYKIPTAFYTVKSIPRTQNQKVDNSVLIELLP